MEYLTNRQPRLLAATDAFHNEARSSWVQRLCGAHQYSISQISEISGVRPPRFDWDRTVGQSQWSNLLELAQRQSDTCAQSIYCLTALERAYGARSVLMYESQRPCSRWCPKCLEADVTPYLRWEWRIAEVKRCTVHNVALDEKCPWCQSRLWIDRSNLVYSGSNGAHDLRTCSACGMSLVDKRFVVDASAGGTEHNLSQMVYELLAEMREASSRADRQLELNFDRFTHLFGRSVIPVYVPKTNSKPKQDGVRRMVRAQKCQSDETPCHQHSKSDAPSAKSSPVEIESPKTQPQGAPPIVRNPFDFLCIGRRRIHSLKISGRLFAPSNAGKFAGDRRHSWRSLLLPADITRITATLRFVRREIRNLRKSGEWPSNSDVMQIPEVDDAFFREYMKGNHEQQKC